VKREVVVAAVSLVWGLLVAVGAYAIERAIQSLVSPDPNPRAIVWSAHAGYFWRVLTVTYAGGIAAFVVLLLARQRIEALARGLLPAVGVVAALLALQAVFFP
jgi:hypothetical protein